MTALAYYILKVIICSGILFMYYHIALKNKLFHQWNRFYLLSAVLFSLLLPLLQFTIFYSGEDENNAIQLIQAMQSADNYLEAFTVSAPASVTPEQWILSAYLLVCILLFSSFIISLAAIFSLLKKHSVRMVQNIKFVGTKEPGTPFSFLNYIFWNDAISLQSQTGQQIFQHELVHVKEKHTLDKLAMQVVLALFWLNPFFWLIRRELKFIHEFIADKKAVGQYGAEAFAAMILQTVYPQQYHSITNQFFQTSIKRRLLMLTKIQHPKVAYLSRIIALPLIAVTVFAFTVRTKPAPASIQQAQLFSEMKEPVKAINRALIGVTDTIPKSNKAISSIDVRTKKEITINYVDGSCETMTEQEANKRGLINNGGFGNEKLVAGNAKVSELRFNTGNLKPLYIVDGKEATEEEISKLNPEMIQSINVLKDKSATVLYGEKGKDGVVEITKKQSGSNTPIDIHTGDGRTLKGNITHWNVREKGVTLEANIETIKPGAPSPLYFVDGKEITNEEMSKIDSKMIESVNVLKGQSAIIKYGDKGRNGVVEIKTRKAVSGEPLTLKENGKDVMTGKVTGMEFKPNNVTIKAQEITVVGYATPKKPLNKAEEVTVTGYATRKTPLNNNNPVFEKAEFSPSVDQDAWRTFLDKNTRQLMGQIGNTAPSGKYTVNVSFIIEKDGSISNIRLLNDPGHGIGPKVLEMMKHAPKWKPAIQNQKVVRSTHTQPITFVIADT